MIISYFKLTYIYPLVYEDINIIFVQPVWLKWIQL